MVSEILELLATLSTDAGQMAFAAGLALGASVTLLWTTAALWWLAAAGHRRQLPEEWREWVEPAALLRE